MSKDKILVIGASGQVGTELVLRLREIYPAPDVVAADIKVPKYEVLEGGPFEILNVLDVSLLTELARRHRITEIYLFAALLSATSEQSPDYAWRLNIDGLLNTLNAALQLKVKKVFWPSSIAVFGPGTPRDNTPQHTITEPVTVYGICKLTGERWCQYYHQRHGLDIRSIRYAGLIGYKSEPGGGTTDYAVNIFYEARRRQTYRCFLKADTILPMMYMPDGVRATIELMAAPAGKIKIRSSYNVAGMSFSPGHLAAEIKKHIPEFTCTYHPDERQKLADTWPRSIGDKPAGEHWGWKPEYDLASMTEDMLKHIA